ncbi:polyisoprenoid-binding protein [Erythrobacter sp. KY5]|uniref:YceI family protein n=1 Tax=Erythrobacter sp. KY5 TaxID=2011159 RepID=UPI000DBF2237|nr:YceI family protein [Erythrobacter sp. KY5]AWW75452.1 polyisoprenoid-binding protein [Erythrobacter sp. KY5]
MTILRLILASALAVGVPTAIVAQSGTAAASQATLNYRLDATASRVSARVPFFGISSKTARFPQMSGDVRIVPGAPERAVIDVTFDARALEAPDETTLRRLRGEKFFWVERYPTIRFVGTSINLSSPTKGKVTGKLTARGVTNTETLEVTFASDPTVESRQAVRFTGEMEIDRREYGMRSYQLIVGNNVDIKLDARMVPRGM